MKRIIDISDDTFNILKNMIEANCVDPYSLADIIVNKSIPYEEKSSDENVQTQSLISRYQNDFVSSQTEVVKVGEPLMTIEEIRRKCADYNAFQNIGLIPRWTDKLSVDNEGNIRDFNGNIVGHCDFGGTENGNS